MNKESNCNDGHTSFFLARIDCELMNWYRELASKNRRAVTTEIIIAMEKNKQEHDKNNNSNNRP